MAYTDIDDPSAFFQTKLYTGTGSSNAITGVGFQPDFCWIKNRGTATAARVFDSVRGATKVLYTSETDAEGTNAQSLKSFDSDGFTMGTHATLNASSNNIVSWNWKGGTALNNSAGANGGSIATTGSINTTSGFGIVKYEGSGANATIYHGLGKIPRLIITKNIDQTFHWSVYTFNSNTKILRLNGTNAEATETAFQSTHPTATVQSLGDHNQNNGDGDTHISYMFCDVPGYQKIGSYTGNGNADGNFIYLGFKPAFILLKGTANTENWSMYDNKRLGYNVDNNVLYPNAASAEGTSDDIDFLSNGFKIRRQTGLLNDAQNYIYMACAEQPFVTSTGVPATAR